MKCLHRHRHRHRHRCTDRQTAGWGVGIRADETSMHSNTGTGTGTGAAGICTQAAVSLVAPSHSPSSVLYHRLVVPHSCRSHVLASVAQCETELRGERVRAGQTAARANGKRWDGSKKGRRVKVSDLQVRTIRELKAAGEPVTAIARTVGLSRTTIYSVLGAMPPMA